MRGTTGESGTRETRIAQPQIGSFPERMYKHTAEFFWEVWLFYEWIVCLSVTETMQGETQETFKETVKTQANKTMQYNVKVVTLILKKALNIQNQGGQT